MWFRFHFSVRPEPRHISSFQIHYLTNGKTKRHFGKSCWIDVAAAPLFVISFLSEARVCGFALTFVFDLNCSTFRVSRALCDEGIYRSNVEGIFSLYLSSKFPIQQRPFQSQEWLMSNVLVITGHTPAPEPLILVLYWVLFYLCRVLCGQMPVEVSSPQVGASHPGFMVSSTLYSGTNSLNSHWNAHYGQDKLQAIRQRQNH